MIRVVLLDAGNTLVELNWPSLARVFADHGFSFAPDAIREAAGRSRAELNRYLEGDSRSTEGGDARGFAMRLVLDRLEVPEVARDELVDAILAPDTWRWNLPVPGCEEALPALRAAGYRLGVVSNSDGSVARLLEEAGVAHHMETIVDSTVVGVEKPDPDIFRIALGRLGVSPEAAVYVGDIPSVDVVGARAAGIAPILIDPFDQFPEADAPRIRDLSDLLRLLADGLG